MLWFAVLSKLFVVVPYNDRWESPDTCGLRQNDKKRHSVNPFTADQIEALQFAILVWPTIFNFWHSGALALSPERQSARMSEIKHGGLDQYGAGPFEQQQFGTAGVERVNRCLRIPFKLFLGVFSDWLSIFKADGNCFIQWIYRQQNFAVRLTSVITPSHTHGTVADDLGHFAYGLRTLVNMQE